MKSSRYLIIVSLLGLFLLIQAASGQGTNPNSTVVPELPANCVVKENQTAINCTNGDFSNLLPLSDIFKNVKHIIIENSTKPIEIMNKMEYPELETLHLTNVGLRYIKDSAFISLNKLTTLTLADNQLTSITKKTLEGLTALQTLVLEGNPLHAIHSGTFSDFPKLFDLKLQRCSLYELEEGWISNLPQLKVLYLQNNYLTLFPALNDSTAGLTSLKELYLEYNKISHLNETSLSIPKSLTSLWLHHNDISTVVIDVEPESELAKSSLEELSLDYNIIWLFQIKGMELMKNLKNIDIKYNHIKAISEEDISLATSLNRLLVEGNPFDCSECTASWLFSLDQVSKYNGSDLRCHAPIEVYNMSVYDSRVFSSCKPDSTQASLVGAGIIITLMVIILCVALVLFIRRRRRLRRERAGFTAFQGGAKKSGGSTYRQMESLSEFSIHDDD